MKKCVPSLSFYIFSVLIVVLCAAAALFSFYQLLCGNEPAVLFLSGVVVFGWVSVSMLCRTVHMCGWGVFYDEEKIIFVLSRKDRREFKWEELKEARNISYYPFSDISGATIYFKDGDKKKEKKICVTSRMKGYNDFLSTLEKKGFIAPRCFIANEVDLKEIVNSVFGEQFGKDNSRRK